MRLQPKYKNENRTLVRLADGEAVPTDALNAVSLGGGILARGTLAAVRIARADVEIEKEQYNEAYLAELRDFLKAMEEGGTDAIIVCEADGGTAGDVERFTAAMVHTARRIKDCASVAGFAVPDNMALDEAAVGAFIAALAVKHPQYLYFSSSKTQDIRLIPYSLR